MEQTDTMVFEWWGTTHLLALISITILCTGILIGARKLNTKHRELGGKVLGGIFLLTYLAESIGRVIRVHWEPWTERLPLHFCSFMSLVCFFALWGRCKWASALAFFGVITASVQGLITPMLYRDFPSVDYFAFFIGHGLLFISALYIPIVLEWRARPWDDLRSLLICDIYLLCIHPINLILDTNYGFTQIAPKGSILEWFGEAPWCYLAMQIPAFLVLRALYLCVRKSSK